MQQIILNKDISFNTVIGNAEEFDITVGNKDQKNIILSLALQFSRSVK